MSAAHRPTRLTLMRGFELTALLAHAAVEADPPRRRELRLEPSLGLQRLARTLQGGSMAV